MILLGRQPILTPEETIAGYELLFRNEANSRGASFEDHSQASAQVIVNALQSANFQSYSPECPAYINIDAAFLSRDFVKALPPGSFVFEILEHTRVDADLIELISGLRLAGYSFAFDDFEIKHHTGSAYQDLLKMVQIVKLDLATNTPEEILNLIPFAHGLGLRVLLEKVETREQYQRFRYAGADYFQGYYFAAPVLVHGPDLTPAQHSVLMLIRRIAEDAENHEIAGLLRGLPDISVGLLRYLNSSAAGLRFQVTSIEAAVRFLGHKSLLRWLLLVQFAAGKQGKKEPGFLAIGDPWSFDVQFGTG